MGARAGRGRRPAVHDLLRRRQLQRRLRAGRQSVHRRRARRHRLAAGRRAGRPADRPDRDVVVGLLLDRLQGCRRLLHSGRHARSSCPPACSAGPTSRRSDRDGRARQSAAAVRSAAHAAAVKDACERGAAGARSVASRSALRTEQNISNQLVLRAALGLCRRRGRSPPSVGRLLYLPSATASAPPRAARSSPPLDLALTIGMACATASPGSPRCCSFRCSR